MKTNTLDFNKEIEDYFRKNSDNKIKRLKFKVFKLVSIYVGEIANCDYFADEIVMKTLGAIKNGKRTWNKNKCPDFESFLHYQLFSTFGSSVTEYKRRNYMEVEETHTISNVENNTCYFDPEVVTMGKNNKSFRKRYLEYDDAVNYVEDCSTTDQEFNVKEKEFTRKIENILNKDPIAKKVIFCMIDGIKSNIEIAKFSELTVNEVENAKDRISRNSIIKKAYSETF